MNKDPGVGKPDETTDELDAPTGTRDSRKERTKSARLLRSVWRLHFYSAFIAVPFLLLEILTGLVILYTHPIMGALYGDIMRVEPAGHTVSLQEQRVAADEHAPGGALLEAVQMPKERGDATVFQYPQDDGYLDVYVNPHTGDVTGTHANGHDIVGLANRLHGFINVESVTIPLPSLSHLIDPSSGPLVEDYVVGDLVLEVCAGWALVLTLTGLFLWWPRRSQKGKALLIPRVRKRGLIRWRDIHAASGILAIAALLLFLTTGLPWSGYWGQTWGTVSAKVTPGDGPWAASASSSPAKLGDLTRYGKPIPWAIGDNLIPASDGGAGQTGHEGHGQPVDSDNSGATAESLPAPVDLDVVEQAAKDEGLLTGYSIYLPVNERAKDGTPTYGSYTLMNFWPRGLDDERTVILDQFSAKTLLTSDASDYGLLQATTSLGIDTHMGTQFGLLNTIWITASCILLLIAIGSSFAMWWIRRPSGRLGLPRRPASPGFTASVVGVTVALMIVYPLWGVTALVVLAADKFVVRRIPALRRASGMPS